jgi:hypothetical protein
MPFPQALPGIYLQLTANKAYIIIYSSNKLRSEKGNKI